MNTQKWIKKNIGEDKLAGKTVAITGSTGGLGRPLCRYIAGQGADLILLDRNEVRSHAFARELRGEYPDLSVKNIRTELEDIESVRAAVSALEATDIDIFIHNAGAYSIPRHKTSQGFDNVYMINFVSPYYMIRRLMPKLREREGRVMVVGSIAHNYSKIDENDIDFSTRSAASRVYGNAKRYLMFSLYELFKEEKNAALSVTHPGITVTNITAHYPKVIYALIKYPMKLIFDSPEKAALSLFSGLFSDCGYHEWIGPRLFNIWGLPRKKSLRTASAEECKKIKEAAEKIWQEIKETET